jgi:serine/threonine protein kinase
MDDNWTDFAPVRDENKARLRVGDSEPLGNDEPLGNGPVGDDERPGDKATEVNKRAGESTGANGEIAADEDQSLCDDRAGHILAGTYRLGRCLGTGGTGVVYEASHLILNNTVALKLLNQMTAGNPEVIERFRREAVAISSLDHANIVRLHTFDVDENDQAYLVMDLVQGQSLSERLKKRGRFTPREALQITSQVLDALSHAHAHHIIHRDIKPGNIMVIEKPDSSLTVKVVDFGLAKILGTQDGLSQNLSLTKSGEMLGSPHYMSPEQCTGDPLDERSDIYSTGCVLYEMLSGQPPFNGDNFLKILHLHATSAHKALTNIDIPPTILDGINKILKTAMAKGLDARYTNAEKMRKDIQALLQSDWTISGSKKPDNQKTEGQSGPKVKSSQDNNVTAAINADDNENITPPQGGYLSLRKQVAELILLAMGITATVAVFTTTLIHTGNVDQTKPLRLSNSAGQVDPALYNPKKFSVQYLSAVDPSTNKTIYYTASPGSILELPNLLATGDKPATFTRNDSTIDGGIPNRFLTDFYIKFRLDSLTHLEGRAFAAPDPTTIIEGANSCLETGDISRAVGYYQKLLTYSQLNGRQEAVVRTKLGDCYMYYDRFDAAAKEYLAASDHLKKAEDLPDIDLLAETQLKLAYCQRAGVALPDHDYALEAFRIMQSHRQESHGLFGANVLLGDINLMRGAPAEALLNYDEAFPRDFNKTTSISTIYPDLEEYYAGLLELRRGKAYLALQQPDQALGAMHRAQENIRDANKALATHEVPELDRKKQADALLPPVYYTIGLAYEQKYKQQADDQDSYNSAISSFEQALRAAMQKDPGAKDSAFAEMCLGKIWRLAPAYVVTLPSGKHNVADLYWRVVRLKPLRSVLPPSFLFSE